MLRSIPTPGSNDQARLKHISHMEADLENRIFPQVQGGNVFQPVGAPKEVPLGYILQYVEELKDVSNAEIGEKDVFKQSVSIQK